jgi:hypothetical protein
MKCCIDAVGGFFGQLDCKGSRGTTDYIRRPKVRTADHVLAQSAQKAIALYDMRKKQSRPAISKENVTKLNLKCTPSILKKKLMQKNCKFSSDSPIQIVGSHESLPTHPPGSFPSGRLVRPI